MSQVILYGLDVDTRAEGGDGIGMPKVMGAKGWHVQRFAAAVDGMADGFLGQVPAVGFAENQVAGDVGLVPVNTIGEALAWSLRCCLSRAMAWG